MTPATSDALRLRCVQRLTSLDPQDVSSHPLHNASPRTSEGDRARETAWRHSCWSRRRSLIRAALSEVYGDCPRLARFDACGQQAWIYQSDADPTRFVVRGRYCGDRWCVPCCRSRTRVILDTIARQTRPESLRLVTLTLRADAQPLSDRLSRLRTSFAKLRRSKCWSRRVRGGMAVAEVKRSSRLGHWHPHLHILVEGDYLPHTALRAAWHQATSDSTVVDVRRVRSLVELRAYVSKYISKQIPTSIARTAADLREAVSALHGRKLTSLFGTWHGADRQPTECNETWSPFASLAAVVWRAAAGDRVAGQLLEELSKCEEPSPTHSKPSGYG